MYPTGHAGFRRAWDGRAWTGPVLAGPGSPELHARRSFARAFGHPTLYLVVGGVVLGWLFASIGGGLQSPWLLAVAAVLGTGGPLLGLTLLVRRRLGIAALHVRSAWLWGALSAALALGIAWLVEPLVFDVTRSTTLFYASAGPIEEGGKLLLPFALLLFGPRIFRDPRVGIFTVIVCGMFFGIVEGVEYLLKADHVSAANGETIAQVGVQDAVAMLATRTWVELGHIIWTAGAAAVIWLAAHRLHRAFTWVGLGAFGVAAALHSLNDAVFNQLYRIDRLLGLVGVALAIGVMVLAYVLWFRARARQAVGPDLIETAPKRWVPRLSRRQRAGAVPPVD